MERGKVYTLNGQKRIILRLPRIFYEDHRDRDLPSGSPKRWLRNQVDVELTREEFDELLSDAHHYASDQGWDFDGMRSLCASATRTVKALEPYEGAW